MAVIVVSATGISFQSAGLAAPQLKSETLAPGQRCPTTWEVAVMTKEPAILIWLAPSEVPQAPSFAVAGAATYDSLADALVAAQRDSRNRPECPWISTKDAIFGPEHIRVLVDTLIDPDA